MPRGSSDRSFYSELDREKELKKQKSLSFVQLVLFFVVLIAVCEIALFSFGTAIRKKPQSDFAVKGFVNAGVNLSSTVESNGQFSTTISQGTLCSALTEKLNSEITCSIESEGVVISGKISTLLPKNASVWIVPKAENGKIRTEISKATIGTIKVPEFIIAPIGLSVTRALESNLPADTSVSKIDLEPAVMVIWSAIK